MKKEIKGRICFITEEYGELRNSFAICQNVFWLRRDYYYYYYFKKRGGMKKEIKGDSVSSWDGQYVVTSFLHICWKFSIGMVFNLLD